MKKIIALYAVVPVLTLVGGFIAGSALNRPLEKVDVIPPFSVKNFQHKVMDELCADSAAFRGLSFAAIGEQKALERVDMQTTALSDRGVICRVRGTLFTKRRLAGSATVTAEPIETTILVSVTGESELITDEFAQALANSPAVLGMTSNEGNDGTVIRNGNYFAPGAGK